jgi:endonuclease/exonuclease/phosphatase family metal-dependent hydrolase
MRVTPRQPERKPQDEGRAKPAGAAYYQPMRLAVRISGLFLLAVAVMVAAIQIANSGQDILPPRDPGTLRVATWNVHYILLHKESGPWSAGDWERRKGPLDDAFKMMDADVVAFQEMESFAGGDDGSVNLARDFLLAENPGYAAAATGDWRTFPSTQPIFYRNDRLRLMDQGWFFFSETPEVIYSRTFDGSYPAFASWADFADRHSGGEFRVVNVHFEYKSRGNRLRSAELVRDRIAPVVAEGRPVFLLGDTNARPGARTNRILEEAGLRFAPVEGATYHFNRGLNFFGPIDHVAVTSQVRQVGDPVVLRRKFRGEWPSDHYPVVVDLRPPG